ncbi:MAG: signal recognition particle protein [Gemmataceae bacterium]|nr:signal recognition particle protein [Gemmataceae bacterium]
MFDSISKALKGALDKFTRGKLTADNIREGLREVRRAFLEADVNFNVTNDFIARVEAQAIGQDVISKAKPSEQIIQIVYNELVQLMGPVDPTIKLHKDRPTVLMMCGLQGAGKTTTCGKLALRLQKEGIRPLLVAADLQRPAAIEQLKVIGQQIGVPVYSETSDPVTVCQKAVEFAKSNSHQVVILDTAGRLQIDEELMQELAQIDRKVRPDEVYLVVDAMIGQEAANVSKVFNDRLALNGVILTKLDGDARGGAALSVKAVTGVPIKFIGMGEKLQALEDFRPEGMASRIMGQGDLMGLVGKMQTLQQEMTEEERARHERIAKGEKDFTLEDFRGYFVNLKKMGIKEMIGSLPGMSEMMTEDQNPEEALSRMQGMIDSMPKKEHRDPDIIDQSRRKRIAAGSGVQPQEVTQFLKQFSQMREIMRKMLNMSMWQRIRMMTSLSKMGALSPGGPQIKTKGDTGHRKSPRERAEERKKKKKRK